MAKVIWVCAILLFFAHQDFWFWDDTTLVFGFMPIGLFYHAMYSIAVACLWAAATIWAWPSTVEDFGEQAVEENSAEGGVQ